jgi:hypothetical protein
MKGSLILEKVNDPVLRHEWEKRLVKLNKALKHLVEIKYTSNDELSKMEYIQAVLEFAEARDNERQFFWDKFVEMRVAGQAKR